MLYKKSKVKDIISNQDEILSLVHDTVDRMACIVGRTLGPGGRPVLIERQDMPPLATKDGVTVAKSIGLANASANLIVDAAKEICINTAREAGDGTTTAIVLANALIKTGHQFVSTHKTYNPQKIVRELKYAYEKIIVPYIKSVARAVENEEELLQVARISANGDDEIAKVVVEAVLAAGDDGKVLIVEGQGGALSVETIDGYVVTTGLKDLGQIGPAFINDRSGQQVKMDNGLVVLYDGSLNDLKVPSYIQDAVADENGYTDATPIIVFAHSFSDVVLDKFAKTTKGGMSIIPVKTPRSGLPNSASMFLQDMAAYTGGTVYDPSNVEDISRDQLGKFDSARVTMYETFLMGSPDVAAIEQRVAELKSLLEQAFHEMDKGHLRAAIAKLTGGVSTIHVGGTSDLEIREKKARVEDAEEAVRSAIAEGIVPGGAMLHRYIARLLSQHPDYKLSYDILITALEAPITLLLSNCGEDVKRVLSAVDTQNTNTGMDPSAPGFIVFDAESHDTVNALDAGIIEPAKVVRVSIANALSVASLLSTLGGLVVTPYDAQLEMQMELTNQTFKNMMTAAEE